MTHTGSTIIGATCYNCGRTYSFGPICDECQKKEYRGWTWDCKKAVLQLTGELREATDGEWYLNHYGDVAVRQFPDLRWGPILKVIRYEESELVYHDTTLEITCDNCHEPFTAYFQLISRAEQVTAACTHCSAVNSFGVDEIK
jgi:hypothetical protein